MSQSITVFPNEGIGLVWAVVLFGAALVIATGGVAVSKWSYRRNSPLSFVAMSKNRNRLEIVVVLFLTLVTVFAGYLTRTSWVSAIEGPRRVTTAEMVSGFASGNGHRWFILPLSPIDLNTVVVKLRKKSTRAYHAYIYTGEPSAVLETTNKTSGAPTSVWVSGENPVATEIAAAASRGYGRLFSNVLTPSYGHPEFERMLYTFGLLVIAIGVPLLLVFSLRRNMLALSSLSNDPLLGFLKRSARASEGVDALVAEVDAQAEAAGLTLASEGVFFLPSWLLARNQRRFVLMSIDDVVWIVSRQVATRFLGIPISSRDIVYVIDRDGRRIESPVAEVDGGFDGLCRRIPWAFSGPDTTLEGVFGAKGLKLFKSKRAMEDIAMRVDQRRRTMRS